MFRQLGRSFDSDSDPSFRIGIARHGDRGARRRGARLADGMLRLGLLKGTLAQVLKDHTYRRFYMHKTGHWLGLDVHDVGDYRIDGDYRLLEPDMIFTVEPGLYIPPGTPGIAAKWQGIGVRIEDDVAITKTGNVVLTDAVPKEADAIEALMADAHRAAA